MPDTTSETRPSRLLRRPPPARWWTRAAGVLITVLVIGAVLLVVYHATRVTVTVTVGAESHRVRTQAATVRDVLDDLDIWLDPEDVVQPGLDTPLDGGMAITVRRAVAVALLVDGVARQVRTQVVQPLDVLAEQGVSVGPHDIVEVNGQAVPAAQLTGSTWETPVSTIRVIRSVPLTVIDEGQALTIHTTALDVGRALDAAGVDLFLADRIMPSLDTPVIAGLTVTIERAVPLTVLVDGQQLDSRALGPTVGDALAAIGIAPVGLDYTQPALDEPLETGLTIRVVRVTEDIITKDEPIPFTTIYRPDTELATDENRVIQEGTNGLRRYEIRVRYEDGQEVDRTERAWIEQSPTPRLIAYGKRAP